MRHEPGKKSADWVLDRCSRCPRVCPTPFHGQIRLECGWEGAVVLLEQQERLSSVAEWHIPTGLLMKNKNTIRVTFVLYHFSLYGYEGSFFPCSAQSTSGWSLEALWDGGRAFGKGTAGLKSSPRVLLALCPGIYLVGLFSLHSPHYKKTEGICTFSNLFLFMLLKFKLQ